MTQGGNGSKNCTEVRMMFRSGPAVYQKEIVTKDVNSLKVMRKIKNSLTDTTMPIFFELRALQLNHAKWLAKLKFPGPHALAILKPRVPLSLLPCPGKDFGRFIKPFLGSKSNQKILFGKIKLMTSDFSLKR